MIKIPETSQEVSFPVMPDIYKITDLKDSFLWWIPGMRRSAFIIYWLIIFLFLFGIISLFIIHVDISVRAPGIIRPILERTEMRSPVSGIIDTIYFKEGDQVLKSSLLLKIHDPFLVEKQHLNESEILQYKDFIHDLNLLGPDAINSIRQISVLKSQLYRQQVLRFISHSEELESQLSKARHEIRLNEKLAKEKVISPKELYDLQMQEQRLVWVKERFRREQLTNWQVELAKYTSDLKQCLSKREELNQQNFSNHIRAPVSGRIQEFAVRYSGNMVQSGDLICSISPEGQLIGECYVLNKDIGMLITGQPVRFQIDALNYNYFGMATGKIFSIENDFILLDKTPVFKVRCQLNEKELKLYNGYRGELKKGMHFQARFITCNRSLWQLLYDRLDDWFNPAA